MVSSQLSVLVLFLFRGLVLIVKGFIQAYAVGKETRDKLHCNDTEFQKEERGCLIGIVVQLKISIDQCIWNSRISIIRGYVFLENHSYLETAYI